MKRLIPVFCLLSVSLLAQPHGLTSMPQSHVGIVDSAFGSSWDLPDAAALQACLARWFAPERMRVLLLGCSAPPKDSPALQLLQQVRDEAHRFGLSYHHTLRRKKLNIN